MPLTNKRINAHGSFRNRQHGRQSLCAAHAGYHKPLSHHMLMSYRMGAVIVYRVLAWYRC